MAPSKETYLIDLHLHTDVSPCGGQSLKECLFRAREVGLSLIVITDHFSTEAASELSLLGLKGPPTVLVGQEYSTRDGDFLLLTPGGGLTMPRGLPTEEVLAEVHAAGGLTIWAHPFRWRREVREELLGTGLVDAIEVLNGRTPPFENEKARLLAEAYGLPGTAGSDAHFPEEIGSVANECPEELKSASDLIEAVKAGLLRPKILSPALKGTYSFLKGYR